MGIRTLIVGDPHLQVQRLDDGRKFIERIYNLAIEHEMLIILGDMFDTFAVVRSEVLSLWAEFFHHLRNKTPVIALVGNHDFCGQQGGCHALEVFRDRISVVDSKRPSCFAGIYFLPFIRDKGEFEKAARECPRDSVLFCHQSFTGAVFNEGYFDPDGADPACVGHLGAVISGHVHTRQTIGNIWYPGTPFQHTFADVGQEKRVFSLHLSQTGYNISKEHDLGMPRFEMIQVKDLTKPFNEALLEALPIPKSDVSYKIVGRASPSEIAEFWKSDKAKALRAQARRVVDAMIPERGTIDIPGNDGKTRKEKLELFIRGKKWRTATDRLCVAAGTLVSF